MTGEIIFKHTEPVMGTIVSFEIHVRGLAYEHSRAALARACDVLHRADDVFSLYRPDTPLSRLRRGELALVDCPPEVPAVHELCERALQQSGGWFDPWAMPGGFDPTGLVKGWAARDAAAALARAGVGAAIVNAAGDIVVFGHPSSRRGWRVGIRSPEAADRLLCVVDVTGAVATSGSYERGEHVLDAHTGSPARAAVSATVCGPDLALADAFATGLLAAGTAGFDAIVDAGYQALVVTPERVIAHTDGFPFARGKPGEPSTTPGDVPAPTVRLAPT